MCCTQATQAGSFQSDSTVIETDKPAPTEQVSPETEVTESEQTDTDKKSVKEQLQELAAENKSALLDWRKEYKATKSRVAQAKLRRKNPQFAYAAKVLEIYEANPDDKDAQAALPVALRTINPKVVKTATAALLQVAREQDREDARKSYIALVSFGSPDAKPEAVDRLFEFVQDETDDAIALEMLKPIANPRVNYRMQEAVEAIWDRVKDKPEEADFNSLMLVGLRANAEASKIAYLALLKHHSDHKNFATVLSAVPSLPRAGFEFVVKKVASDAEGDLQTQAAISLAQYIELRHFYLDLKKMPEEQLEKLDEEKQNLLALLKTFDGDSRLHKQAQRELFLIENLSPGLEAPDIVGDDLDGNELKLSDYRGKIVLLTFWGDWCPPCRAMFPHERSLTKTLAGEPFTIIGVNSDKKPNISETVCEPKNLSWPCFTDFQGDTRISSDWGVRSWPTTYLIDKDGIIRFKGLRGSRLDIALQGLLAEMDVDVNLRDIDHEAEDKIAMEAYQETRRANGSDDSIGKPK